MATHVHAPADLAVKEGREAWRGENCGCTPVEDAAAGPRMIQIESLDRRQS